MMKALYCKMIAACCILVCLIASLGVVVSIVAEERASESNKVYWDLHHWTGMDAQGRAPLLNDIAGLAEYSSESYGRTNLKQRRVYHLIPKDDWLSETKGRLAMKATEPDATDLELWERSLPLIHHVAPQGDVQYFRSSHAWDFCYESPIDTEPCEKNYYRALNAVPTIA